MAKPRVFISSTYYDLKYLRASLEAFVDSLGYEAVLSEKGAIAYSPDQPLDESCYREVRSCDIFVLIIGGRYGSERSGSRRANASSFFARYDSITKTEYSEAASREIPTYIFIERSVYAEYHTFLRNREREDVAYAHVDSINIFLLVEEILGRPNNNPVREFDRYEEIETWLRDQWAGLMKDMLQRASSQRQLTSLQREVSNVAAIGETLKSYMENVVRHLSPKSADSIINAEGERLTEARAANEVRASNLGEFLVNRAGIAVDDVVSAFLSASSVADLMDRLRDKASSEARIWLSDLEWHPQVTDDANALRRRLGQPEFPRATGPEDLPDRRARSPRSK